MDTNKAATCRRDLSRSPARLTWPRRLVGRRPVVVAATVLAVLALAAWAMTGFYANRPSPLPRKGKPMPDLSALEADLALQSNLLLVTAALTRRGTGNAVLVEAVYNTPEVFAALSRHDAAQQGGDEAEAETLRQEYQRYHETDRYLVFTLVLESNGFNLEDYQPLVKSLLRTASGREVSAARWEELRSPAPDRHREGLLHVPRLTVDQPVLMEDDGWLELVLSDLDGGEWALRWELPIANLTVPTTREKE